MSNHEESCKCDACLRGIEEFMKDQEKIMEEYGWIFHIVSDDPEYPHGINCHTHGLVEKFNHQDLQIVLPVEDNVLGDVLHSVVDRIRTGDRFHADQVVLGILQNDYPVKFIKAYECGREVLRVILPDVYKSIDPETMTPEVYRQQYDCLGSPLDATREIELKVKNKP